MIPEEQVIKRMVDLAQCCGSATIYVPSEKIGTARRECREVINKELDRVLFTYSADNEFYFILKTYGYEVRLFHDNVFPTVFQYYFNEKDQETFGTELKEEHYKIVKLFDNTTYNGIMSSVTDIYEDADTSILQAILDWHLTDEYTTSDETEKSSMFGFFLSHKKEEDLYRAQLDVNLAEEILYKIHREFGTQSGLYETVFPRSGIGKNATKYARNARDLYAVRESDILMIIPEYDTNPSGLIFTDKAIYYTKMRVFGKSTSERCRYDSIKSFYISIGEYVSIFPEHLDMIDIKDKFISKASAGLCIAFMTGNSAFIQKAISELDETVAGPGFMDRVKLLNYHGKTLRELADDIKNKRFGQTENPKKSTTERTSFSYVPEEQKSWLVSEGIRRSANKLTDDMLMEAHQGHGFAAERANDLFDSIQLKDTRIVGTDNVKNGPDRLVNGVEIQTKYYQTAEKTINACFENGKFRYFKADGTPMQIEVPADQYSDAVTQMSKKISEGKVPGVTDPKMAEDIVKKGTVSYTQARNIAQAGTIESITYDAMSGAIVATSAFGISATIEFATALWDGKSLDEAALKAVHTGIKVAGVSFLSHIIAAQALKAGANAALVGNSTAIVRMLGPKASAVIVQALTGKAVHGAAAMTSAAKLLRGNIVVSIASVAVLSISDLVQCMDNRMSTDQLVKNLAVNTAGVAGGVAGGLAGGALATAISATGVGALALLIGGAVLAGVTASGVTKDIADSIVKDDAVKMLEIINKRIPDSLLRYILTEKEVDRFIDILQEEIDGSCLKEMYASPERISFIDNLVDELVEKITKERKAIKDVPDVYMVGGVRTILENTADAMQEVEDETLSIQDLESLHQLKGKYLYFNDVPRADLYLIAKEVFRDAKMNIVINPYNCKCVEEALEKIKSMKGELKSTVTSHVNTLKDTIRVAYRAALISKSERHTSESEVQAALAIIDSGFSVAL